MTKRKELEDPMSCFNRADDDELMFVLLGRDLASPAAIRSWCRERVRLGLNNMSDAKIRSAMLLADKIDMDQFRERNKE